MSSPHTWNKIQNPSPDSLQKPAWFSVLHALPPFQPHTPSGHITSILAVPHLPAFSTHSRLESPFPATGLSLHSHPPDLALYSNLITSKKSSWPFFENNHPITNFALSLLFPVFFVFAFISIWNCHVFISITFLLYLCPTEMWAPWEKGLFLLKQSLTLGSTHHLRNEITSLGEMIHPNKICSNTLLLSTSPSSDPPQVSPIATKGHSLYLNPRVTDSGWPTCSVKQFLEPHTLKVKWDLSYNLLQPFCFEDKNTGSERLAGTARHTQNSKHQ